MTIHLLHVQVATLLQVSSNLQNAMQMQISISSNIINRMFHSIALCMPDFCKCSGMLAQLTHLFQTDRLNKDWSSQILQCSHAVRRLLANPSAHAVQKEH